MKELSNFQKQFLAQSGTLEVFTQTEFDEALTLAKAGIMAVAIETTKQAILIERQACADLMKEAGHEELAEKILNRLPSQRQ